MSINVAPRRVLIDTSAYYALTDRGEQKHSAAREIQERLIKERWHLL